MLLLAPPVVEEEAPVPAGALGATVVEDEDEEPPGTTTVSLSFVTVEVGPGLLPGTTVVVDSFSQPARARAPTKTNR